jgi:hypothetical protein
MILSLALLLLVLSSCAIIFLMPAIRDERLGAKLEAKKG